MNSIKKFKKLMFIILPVVLLILALPAGLIFAQGGGANRQAASTGTAFTYQGSLEKSGSGVTSTCSFNFTLYNALTGGSTVGSTVSKSGISVSNGKFSTDLDFGSSAFNGDARYLDIQVQCTGDASMQQLSPRTALTAAPYALSLIPGAVISGTESSILKVVNDTSSGTPYGVYGIASDTGSTTSYGVYGKSNSSVGTGVGGEAPRNGVYGEATSSGINYGVYGKSNSLSGYGVYGWGSKIGIYGTNNSTTGAGVVGLSQNTDGVGVSGETVNGHGVEGIVDWVSNGTGIGIYGSGGFYGSAAYFESATTVTPTVIIANQGGSSTPALVVTGTTHLEGAVTWKAVTGYLAIPPAAFSRATEGGSFYNGGYFLHPGITNPATTFHAPVTLPHGATVTKFTFHWSDSSTSDGSAELFRNDPTGFSSSMALANTSGSGGQSLTIDTTISNSVVDNSQYSYYIELYLPDSTVYAYEIFIEYSITQPY